MVGGTPKSIAVIGGYGKMGAWFARLLKDEGHAVTIIGRDKDKLAQAAAELGVGASDRLERAAEADIIIISVPIDVFEALCRDLSPYVKSAQVILDLTSVKSGPVEAMHRYLGAAATLGAHPVFGPGAKSLDGQNFILTPTTGTEIALAEKISRWLTDRGALVRLTSPTEHDRLMAISLGLAHFIAIVTADALVNLDRLTDMAGASGITYKALLTLVESVLSEDPALYASLQLNLPQLPQIERVFADKAADWAELVKDGRRDDFVGRMSALKDRLEAANPDFGASYRKLYRLADNRIT
jgi:prephenate dehydrogenase